MPKINKNEGLYKPSFEITLFVVFLNNTICVYLEMLCAAIENTICCKVLYTFDSILLRSYPMNNRNS